MERPSISTSRPAALGAHPQSLPSFSSSLIAFGESLIPTVTFFFDSGSFGLPISLRAPLLGRLLRGGLLRCRLGLFLRRPARLRFPFLETVDGVFGDHPYPKLADGLRDGAGDLSFT